jgi:hypothetical protein
MKTGGRPVHESGGGKRKQPEKTSDESFAEAEFRKSVAELQKRRPESLEDRKEFLVSLVGRK